MIINREIEIKTNSELFRAPAPAVTPAVLPYAVDMSRFLPPINRAMHVLDRSFFHRTIPTSAARVHNPRDISRVQKECASDLLRLKRVPPVQEDPEVKGQKLILLWPEVRCDGMIFGRAEDDLGGANCAV